LYTYFNVISVWSYVILLFIRLSNPNPRTYIGSGKVAEIRSAIQALDIETVIFDDELSAG
jgi:50S ribosomal subunit-associated GTPase HflX